MGTTGKFGGSQEFVDEFHRNYPNKASPTSNIRSMAFAIDIDMSTFNIKDTLNEIKEQVHIHSVHTNFTEDPRHYHRKTRQRFTIPSPSENIDAIIPLDPNVTDDFPQYPSSILPNLPPQIHRIWMYEIEPVDAITMVSHLCDKNIPCHLYQLHNPPTSIKIHKKYERLPLTEPRYALSWTIHDYNSHLLLVKAYGTTKRISISLYTIVLSS